MRGAKAIPPATYVVMNEPRRIWWARPGKLCLLERPGGGGRSHRPERRAADIDYLVASGVRVVISTMTTKHNLADYEAAGLEWHHVPVPDCADAADALAEVLRLLRREMRRRGAVAVHGNRLTDFVAAVGAAWMRDADGADPAEALEAAKAAGLRPSESSADLLGTPWDSGRHEPIVRRRKAPA
jgi:hypothetical protein